MQRHVENLWVNKSFIYLFDAIDLRFVSCVNHQALQLNSTRMFAVELSNKFVAKIMGFRWQNQSCAIVVCEVETKQCKASDDPNPLRGDLVNVLLHERRAKARAAHMYKVDLEFGICILTHVDDKQVVCLLVRAHVENGFVQHRQMGMLEKEDNGRQVDFL
ncbi:hypothetical protein PsorP6_006743 [Peronosclerospora sorghi]|uniref:Uncharacterized protein n=1 Tax=Peronosclerospora sorghi TaxID=230839 RepID=A0ACC0W358_9STRA|nr:hypothetical protein PsorP6_006743 [Peronosclerospora sorghi]